jgi:hypothetical protein
MPTINDGGRYEGIAKQVVLSEVVNNEQEVQMPLLRSKSDNQRSCSTKVFARKAISTEFDNDFCLLAVQQKLLIG